MPTLLMSEDGQDSDSDLEIDPGTMSPPAPGSPIRMQESPTVQELLSTMGRTGNRTPGSGLIKISV